ncbi:uroporphyrinogen-III C-methyltransferase [Bacillus solimangrovi]|uniref:Uroporphyrinogen-III C-methyltransferase n=1 Tax=Bacillus solimangrovi TaxID=1305675 RepID=A0A1E5LF97_9BACI|nr:uroporphyrinogen-III C-methyltransferase [Bacillus solimangrovi]OEH92742.1 uroporphyrinogen-III C-methyltransferase [Bacillus solimangrovi]
MGKVYLVGAGPGDPELLTLKGLKCLQKADVVLYDRLVNKELLSYTKEGTELIYCGKLPNYHTMQQETINAFLVKLAKKGKTVVRLKGGDPFVFGRGGEEALALAKHGLEFEVVPGVTASTAAAAYAGIPVTHRNVSGSFAMVTGHRCMEQSAEEWRALAKNIDTLSIYMGITKLGYICERLIEHGWSEQIPVAVIHWGTTEQQRTVTGTLSTIANVVQKNKIDNPSMVIVGEVVRLREKIAWFENINTSLAKEAY